MYAFYTFTIPDIIFQESDRLLTAAQWTLLQFQIFFFFKRATVLLRLRSESLFNKVLSFLYSVNMNYVTVTPRVKRGFMAKGISLSYMSFSYDFVTVIYASAWSYLFAYIWNCLVCVVTELFV